MQIDNINIFPTELKIFNFHMEEIQPLIKEVLSQKQKIKEQSNIFSDHGGRGNYFTDYKNPTKLHEYEKLMIMVGNFFINQKKKFEVYNYWSAFYYKDSLHDTHHHSYLLENKLNNYASVLYLTTNGGTTFFSSNHTSIFHDFFIKSEVGKLVLFPSSLLHNVNNKEDGERIIVSSNIGIFNE